MTNAIVTAKGAGKKETLSRYCIEEKEREYTHASLGLERQTEKGDVDKWAKFISNSENNNKRRKKKGKN